MKKIFKVVGLSLEGILRIAYFVAALVIIYAVTYLMGFRLLSNIFGNDAANAINNIYWVATYFPNIPYWYPLQGGGVSLVWNYPMLSSIVVVIISKISQLGLLASMQTLSFASYFLTALTMYLFVTIRLKSQTAALFSAVFFLIMPLSYGWLVDWGFYAETFSYPFFFPTLIFYDIFLEGFLKGKMQWYRRLSLVFAAIFAALLFNTHPLGFIVLIFLISFQTIIYSLFTLKNKRKFFLQFLYKTFLPPLIVAFSSMFLTAFTVLNYSYYNKVKTFPGSVGRKITHQEFIDLNQIPYDSFVGLGLIPDDHFQYTLRNLVVPPVVWVLALAGMVTTLLFYRKAFSYVVLSVFGFIITQSAGGFYDLIHLLVKIPIPNFAIFFQQRSYLILIRFLFPISAAFAIVGAVRLIFEIPTFWVRFIKSIKWIVPGVNFVRSIFVTVFAVPLFFYILYYAADKPDSLWKWYQARYGYWLMDVRDPFFYFGLKSENESVSKANDLSKVCGILEESGKDSVVCQKILSDDGFNDDSKLFAELTSDCKLRKLKLPDSRLCPFVADNKKDLYLATLANISDLSYWPKANLLSDESLGKIVFPYVLYDDFLREHKDEKNLRIDVSATSGGVTQSLNVVSPNMSMIQLYTNTATIIGPYWGYEQEVLFTEYDKKELSVNNVADWYGTKYLFLNPTLPIPEKYANSEKWEPEIRYQDGVALLKYTDSPEMFTWSENKPRVLFIGSKEKRAYEPFFRAANKGALNYTDAYLIEGEERIDKYSLEELKKFDLIYLMGYQYGNRNRAYNLIDAYLKQGGSVYISTGWQYVDKDWQAEKTPEWFPPTGLSWTNKFNSQSLMDFNLDVIGKIDTSGFGRLEWNQTGYGVSIPGNLRSWAKPVLSVDGKPLVVLGEYGKGKVVWSGLNLIGHMHTFEYPESELSFHRALVKWLASSDKTNDLTDSVEMVRDNPDRIEFTFKKESKGNSSFYWREASFPAWKAYLTQGGKKKPVKIYYGGPRFSFMVLPDVGPNDKLTLEFKPGLRNSALYALSLATFAGLTVYLVLGDKLFKPVVDRFYRKLETTRKKMKYQWEKDEDEYA